MNRRLVLETHAPAWLLGRGQDAAFDGAWERLALPAATWRAHRVLPDAFLKGMAVPLLRGTQMWRRRWDIAREAHNLSVLAKSAVPAATLLAWGEDRRARLPVRAWLLTTLIPQAEDLEQVVRRAAAAGSVNALGPVLDAAGAAVGALHAAGWAHDDLASRNIMVQMCADGPRAFLTDLARAAAHAPGRRRRTAQRVDLYRLAKTTLKHGLPDALAARLLDAAAPGQGAVTVSMTRRIKAITNRYTRMARYHAWTRLGV